MNLRLIAISAACLSICAVPASSTSLWAAAAAVKGAMFGAGLAALKSSGGSGSQTVVIQSDPGTVAEVVSANEVVVRDPVYTPAQPIHVHNVPQTISYTYSSSPLSRFWGAISNAISAKTRAIGELFNPHQNVIIVKVPPTTEKSTTEKCTTEKPTTTTTTTTTTSKPTTTKSTTKKPQESIVIEFEASYDKNPSYRRVHPVSVQYVKK